MQCPQCESGQLEAFVLGDVIIDICRECGGVWFDHDEIASLVSPGEEIRRFESSIPPSGNQDEHRGVCPRCGVALRSHRLGKEREDLVARCPSCLGTWLDRRQIRKMENVRILGAIREYFSLALGEAQGDSTDADALLAPVPEAQREAAKRLAAELATSPHAPRVIAYFEKLWHRK